MTDDSWLDNEQWLDGDGGLPKMEDIFRQTGRLPRKKKKELKNWYYKLEPLLQECYLDFWGQNVGTEYKHFKKISRKFKLFMKYKKEFEFINKECDEGFHINPKTGNLGWYWEDDNGLWCSSGIMDIAYTNEEAKGTWAYSELGTLLNQIYLNKKGNELLTDDEWDAYWDAWVYPTEVVDDKSLLKYIGKLLN